MAVVFLPDEGDHRFCVIDKGALFNGRKPQSVVNFYEVNDDGDGGFFLNPEETSIKTLNLIMRLPATIQRASLDPLPLVLAHAKLLRLKAIGHECDD